MATSPAAGPGRAKSRGASVRRALPPTALAAVAVLALPPWLHPPGRAVPPPGGAADLRGAIERAAGVLAADGDAWMEGRTRFQDGDGCVSCHQVPYGVWGLAEAARAGVAPDPAAAEDLSARALAFVARPRTGRVMSWGPLLLAAGGDPPPAGFVDYALGVQKPPGFWEARGQFPSQRRELSETNAVATMMTLLALAGADRGDEALSAARDRAYKWVADRGEGESAEWQVLRALVEQWRGNAAGAGGRFVALLGEQNADGGWGWRAGEQSNGFSTGQVLWGLARLDRPLPEGGSAAVERAVSYLLAEQGEDGWWRMPSSLATTRAGEGNDYVYSYWGTAWATIGLARWLEPLPDEGA